MSGASSHGAPAAAHWLESLGVRFARTDGAWSLHLEAAHSRARVLHAGGDATGAEIMRALRGPVSGMAVPTYVIDAPGGGGKIPMVPDYVQSRDDERVVFTNWRGDRYEYPSR